MYPVDMLKVIFYLADSLPVALNQTADSPPSTEACRRWTVYRHAPSVLEDTEDRRIQIDVERGLKCDCWGWYAVCALTESTES